MDAADSDDDETDDDEAHDHEDDHQPHVSTATKQSHSPEMELRILPLEEQDEEPLYVNAKQYSRILKRRQQRHRLESLGRVARERKVSLQADLLHLRVHSEHEN